MTREEAIQFLDNMKHEEAGRAIGKDGFYAELMSYHVQALSMAIQALTQEPCDDAISRKTLLTNLYQYKISCAGRIQAAILEVEELVEKMPSVTQKSDISKYHKEAKRWKNKWLKSQKSGKWDRLYNWLNDMRFGIAPDETVTDIDERNVRTSQVDLLDEIMEWMIKAESEE